MFLARRVTGMRIWVYQVRLSERNPIGWDFLPPPGCCLVRQGLSGDGYCAFGRTPQEAREYLIRAEG